MIGQNYLVNHHINQPGDYIVTYWKRNPNETEWQFVQNTIVLPGTFAINEQGYFIDELRIQPVDAMMTTYTYALSDKISSITQPDNTTAYFQYDSFWRVKNILDHKGNILENYKYHYPTSVIP